jgi:AcrR family transcriptional regulator
MIRPRFEKLEADKKQRLLDAAMKEFGSKPFEVASINRILEEAGFSKGSFYYYFDDKADLAVATLAHAASVLSDLANLKLPESPKDFWKELRTVTLGQIRELETNRLRLDVVMRLGAAMAQDLAFAERVMPFFMPRRQRMIEFFQHGVKLGALRSDVPVATLMSLLEASKLAAYKSMFPPDVVLNDAQLESFGDFMLDLMVRICGPKAKGDS